MIVIIGSIKLATPDAYAQVKDALIERAARSRADAGNIEYAFSRSIDDPSEIRLTEVWETEEALNAHLGIADEAFAAVLAETPIASALVTAYTASSTKVLMAR